MKNIHILPTDKSSKLFLNKNNDTFFLNEQFDESSPKIIAYNICITDDSEIKIGDYYYNERLNQVFQAIRKSGYNTVDKEFKVILTTDQDLIADGVQSIDDEFLKWFVKNPSCEEVEDRYKIIIPQEEPKQEIKLEDVFNNEKKKGLKNLIDAQKQETLEELAERILANNIDGLKDALKDDDLFHFYKGVIQCYGVDMAKWQQEQIYNQIKELYDNEHISGFSKRAYAQCLDIIEQFKNK